ncbi:MAG: carbohydrate porin [Thermoanaerobaculia bacterium]
MSASFGGNLKSALIALAVMLRISLGAAVARAQEVSLVRETPSPSEARTDLHFQLTTVTQAHPSFDAPYSGQNSLSPDPEHETTITATLFLGARLWKGAEIYVNPELSGGSGLSHTFGIAGFPNGEAFRVGDAEPRIYLGRLMLRQTVAIGPETEPVEEGANQLGGRRPVRRWTLTVGKFGMGDFFDGNAYSHDPRTQFLNWADWTAGAWDYAADTRGYTWGFVIERDDVAWAARFAATAQPKVANGLRFDTDLLHAYALSGEFERRYEVGGKKGAARLILFYNRANMGNYREAIAQAGGLPPDVTATRRVGRSKWGFVVNLEQAVGNAWGLFLRGSWSDGANEAWAYAEIERSLTVGGRWKGPLRSRPDDEAGVAFILDGLSNDHRDYLTAGGYGFMIGDGRLSYGLETIADLYYQAALVKYVWLAAGYQFIARPAYNRDRGPVHVFGARLHVEF